MLYSLLMLTGPRIELYGQIDLHELKQISDSTFEEGIRSGLSPGAVLSWTDKDSLLFSKAYGYGHPELDIAVDPQRTRFQLGSIGKILTALAVLQLVDQRSLRQALISDSVRNLVTPLWKQYFTALDSGDTTALHFMQEYIHMHCRNLNRELLPPPPDQIPIHPIFNSMGKDYSSEWRSLDIPWYALYGEEDQVIPVDKSIDYFRHQMHRGDQSKYRLDVLPNANHMLIERETGTRYRFEEMIISWLLEQTGSPEVFAPGIISRDRLSMYRASFSPDGRSFYFFRKIDTAGQDYRIYVSHFKQGAWSMPEQIELRGEYSDPYPSISPDGKRMVFSSYRPVPGDTFRFYSNANLWYSIRQDGCWQNPRFMKEASTLSHYDADPRFRSNGDIEYVTTSPDWSERSAKVVHWDGTHYVDPKPNTRLEPWKQWNLNTHFIWNGTLHPSGKLMILCISELETDHSIRPSDLWYAVLEEDGSWSDPNPLQASINQSDKYENFTVFSHDGLYLYFVRDFDKYYRVNVSSFYP